jgi:putative PEP-CTERM system histidine kinase
MTAMAVIWVHALVALLFCGVAVVQARAPTRLVPRWLLVAALGATALWALAVAGIDNGDVAARLAETLRDLAWLAVLATLANEAGGPIGRWRDGAYVATGTCMALAAGVGVAEAMAQASGQPDAPLRGAALTLGMLAVVAGLVLAQRAARDPVRGRGVAGRHLLIAAVALMWSTELASHLLAWTVGDWSAGLVVARGAVMVVVAPTIAIALHRDGEWRLSASRTVALQAVLALSGVLYVVATGIATGFLGQVAGGYARLVQTAFVFGTAAALLVLASSAWLVAWLKVIVAKHLFSHRFDYRAEWMRFTDTLGVPGAGAAPLAERVVKATADLTGSPAGLLLGVAGDALVARAAWRWDDQPAEESDAAPAAGAGLLRHLEGTRRIVDLDAVRHGTAPAAEAAVVPAWLLALGHAWALVPLLHLDRLVGAIVLARPPVARALDWEDFDLLGVAGRQVASYLAEDDAHAALADARRFEEFNRRFAFIMHDLKNMVSQLALVARNAERHADNPAFRADMIATLRDSSYRMTTLLARLSQQPAASDATRPVAVRALAERLADARRAQHPVVAVGDLAATAAADPVALETALGHLLQNAVEASAPGVPVTLAIGTAGDRVAIDVEDHGSGMTPAFLRDELFRPFVSRKPAGFGLGAFEARQLVEAMGGRLEVESRAGAGTRFRILLPHAGTMLEHAA